MWCSLFGPCSVMIIYDKGVCVSNWLMTVRMAMGFWSFPTFVVMLMMEIVYMFVFMEHFLMHVKENGLIVPRPQSGRHSREHQS